MPKHSSLPIAMLLVFTVSSSATECIFKDVERVVAVGDVHGDFEQFVKVLRAAKVIDDKNQWTGGKTHLVQTGDVLDRGPESKKAMDLLMELEEQAPKSGGRVHALIGNHEAMVMLGDYRYLHPGEVKALGGSTEFKKAMAPDGKYGKWISGHNAVVRIDSIIFVHGGIAPKYARTTLKELNDKIRKQLNERDQGMSGPVWDPAGPLWFRGYAMSTEQDFDGIIDPVLKTKKAKHVVVGHTVMKGGIRVRGGGKAIMIDVGMSSHYGGPAACLLIEKGKFFAVRPERKKELSVVEAKASKADK